MNVKYLPFSFIVLFLPIFCLAQTIPQKYEKKYDANLMDGFAILTSKKTASDKIVIDANGAEIIAFDKKKPLIFEMNNGKLLYANNVKGFNDGGGFISAEYFDVEVIDLATRQIEKKDFTVLAHYYENANFVIVKSNNLLGALNKNNALIIPPAFYNIMPLDADAKHYLFLTTTKEYFIADSLGKNILPKNFVYTKQEPTVDFVKDNTILGSFDGSNFGIYNFIDKTEIVPFEFEEAGFVKNEYYRVKKNGVYGLYGSKEHKMLLPFEQGATYVNTVFNTNDKLFIVFEKEIGGKGKTNIYEDGKLLFEERYAVKSIDYGFDFPFITGRIDDDTHFVYDCNARRMIMYGLPYIQNFNQIYYLDEQKEYIVIPAIIDPEKVNGRKIPYIMLANTKGEVVAGFQAQQKFRRVDLSGSSKPIFLCAHNNNVGESFTDIRFKSQEIIASVPTNTSDVNNVKIVDNRIVLLLEAGRPFEIKAKGTVSGGKILIDADGNIDYSTP